MKFVIAAASAALILPAPAIAEPGRDWISIGRVEQIMKARGYRLIEIESKDGVWEGEATRGGRTWDFTMNPKTGRVLTLSPDSD